MALVERASEKPTAERILDAAEDLFAERGYAATSLGDVADRVGIRSPSLYNHFRNKEALYAAVVERLLSAFTAPLEELRREPLTSEGIFRWLEVTVRMHHQRPNLARLLQHAALSGSPHTDLLVDRLFRPMFEPPQDGDGPSLGPLSELRPWAVMGLNNMVMSYITMAPMYRDVLGEDPLGAGALDKQLSLIMALADLVLDGAARPRRS
jgi:AcrR family transcriptional regulator